MAQKSSKKEPNKKIKQKTIEESSVNKPNNNLDK